MKLSVQSGSVIAAAVLQTAVAQGDSNKENGFFPIDEILFESLPLHDEISLSDDIGDSGTVLEIPIEAPEEWTQQNEQKFFKLAQLEALGTLTAKDKAELEKLSVMRYQMKTPRSGEQILLEYQQNKLASDMIQALEKYVAFQKNANYSRK